MAKQCHDELLAMLPEPGEYQACPQGFVYACTSQSKRPHSIKHLDAALDDLRQRLANDAFEGFAAASARKLVNQLLELSIETARLSKPKTQVKVAARRPKNPELKLAGVASEPVVALIKKWLDAKEIEKAERKRKRDEAADAPAAADDAPDPDELKSDAAAPPDDSAKQKRPKLTADVVRGAVSEVVKQEYPDDVVETWQDLRELLPPSRVNRLGVLLREKLAM